MKKTYEKPQMETVKVSAKKAITLSIADLQADYKTLDINTNVLTY